MNPHGLSLCLSTCELHQREYAFLLFPSEIRPQWREKIKYLSSHYMLQDASSGGLIGISAMAVLRRLIGKNLLTTSISVTVPSTNDLDRQSTDNVSVKAYIALFHPRSSPISVVSPPIFKLCVHHLSDMGLNFRSCLKDGFQYDGKHFRTYFWARGYPNHETRLEWV